MYKISTKIKNYFFQGLVYGFGSGFDALIGFLVLPLYATSFSTEEYGIFSILILLSTLSSSFFYLGASSALSRSYFDYDKEKDRRKIVATSLYITVFGAILQVLFGLLFAENLSQILFDNPNYTNHIFLILISSSLLFINQLFYLLLRLLMRSVQVVSVSIFSSIVFLSLLFIFLKNYNLGILSPILAFNISYGLSTIILVFLCRKHFSLFPNVEEFKIQLLFGLPQIIIGFSYYLIDWIDRIFINEYLSLSDVGIYSFAYKIGMLIQIGFVIPFSKIWNPIRSENLNSENITMISSKVLTYFYLFGSIFSLLIIIFIKEFFLLFSGGSDEFIVGQYVVPFVIFGHLFYGMINVMDIGLFKARKPMYTAIILLVHIPINVILNLILIPKIGYYGAAISTLLTYLSLVLSIAYISNKFLFIKYEKRNFFIISFFSCISIFLSIYYFDNLNLFSPYKFLLMLLLLGFYYYYFNQDLKKLLRKE